MQLSLFNCTSNFEIIIVNITFLYQLLFRSRRREFPFSGGLQTETAETHKICMYVYVIDDSLLGFSGSMNNGSNQIDHDTGNSTPHSFRTVARVL